MTLFLGTGAGDWAVQFDGVPSTWNYSGGGEARIAIDNAGSYTVTGGANSVTGQVYAPSSSIPFSYLHIMTELAGEQD